MLRKEDYDEILKQFPPVEFGFAYGSGVIEQGSYNYSQDPSTLPMLDLVSLKLFEKFNDIFLL